AFWPPSLPRSVPETADCESGLLHAAPVLFGVALIHCHTAAKGRQCSHRRTNQPLSNSACSRHILSCTLQGILRNRNVSLCSNTPSVLVFGGSPGGRRC